jgi:hypothetical protein
MKKSQFFSALLLSACVGVYGSEWQELPCKSENIQNVKLEANHSCLRISSGGRVLGTETICEARHNLVEQMTTLVSRQGGFFTISSVERTFEIDYAPQYCPLVGTVGGRSWQRFQNLFIGGMLYDNIKGIGTWMRDVANETSQRSYFEVKKVAQDGSELKFGVAPNSNPNQK